MKQNGFHTGRFPGRAARCKKPARSLADWWQAKSECSRDCTPFEGSLSAPGDLCVSRRAKRC